MYKFLANNGQRLAFGVGFLLTVVFLIVVSSGISEFNTLADEERVNTTIFDLGLYGTIALTIIAALSMVGFGLYHVASNFKSSVKGVLGVAALAAVFIVAYSMASSEPDAGPIAESVQKVGGVTGGQLKFIGGAIITALILTGVATAAFVFSEARNFFK